MPNNTYCGGCGMPQVPGLACCAQGARMLARAKAAAQPFQPPAPKAHKSRPSTVRPWAGSCTSNKAAPTKPLKPHPTQVPGASQVWRTHAPFTNVGHGTANYGMARATHLLRK